MSGRRKVPEGVEVFAPNGTCDLNPEMATLGEAARNLCNECRQPMHLHLTPAEWDKFDALGSGA